MNTYTIQQIKNGYLLCPNGDPDSTIYCATVNAVATALKEMLKANDE